MQALKARPHVRRVYIEVPRRSANPTASAPNRPSRSLVFARTVRVENHGRDRYGRLLGRVYYRDVDLNAESVREGAAWVFVRYCRDPELYRLEKDAMGLTAAYGRYRRHRGWRRRTKGIMRPRRPERQRALDSARCRPRMPCGGRASSPALSDSAQLYYFFDGSGIAFVT